MMGSLMAVKLAAAAQGMVLTNRIAIAATVIARVPATAYSPLLSYPSEFSRGGQSPDVIMYSSLKMPFRTVARIQTPQGPSMPLSYCFIPVETAFSLIGCSFFTHSNTEYLL